MALRTVITYRASSSESNRIVRSRRLLGEMNRVGRGRVRGDVFICSEHAPTRTSFTITIWSAVFLRQNTSCREGTSPRDAVRFDPYRPLVATFTKFVNYSLKYCPSTRLQDGYQFACSKSTRVATYYQWYYRISTMCQVGRYIQQIKQLYTIADYQLLTALLLK